MDDGFVIETRDLSKRYGERIVAVDRLAMRVRRGEVYGFLALEADVGGLFADFDDAGPRTRFRRQERARSRAARSAS